jgi:hypothetical protein
MPEPDAAPPIPDRFVSEPIVPIGNSFRVSDMATAEPGLPMRFRWRDVEYEVARVVEKWKTTSDCRNGSSEQYVRKHWFRVVTTDGTEMRIYFERQARPGPKSNKKRRWWLATVSRAPASKPMRDHTATENQQTGDGE